MRYIERMLFACKEPSMRSLILIIAGCVVSVAIAADRDAVDSATADSDDAEMSVEIMHEKTDRQKVVYFWYTVRVKNESPDPRWIICPTSADKPLPSKPQFSNPYADQPLGGTRIAREGGTLIKLEFEPFSSFEAICVQGKSSVTFDMSLIAPKNVPTPKNLRMFVAKDILVNGETPVEKWFPFSLISDKDVDATSGKIHSIASLNWDVAKKSKRTDLPTEAVRYTTAKDAVLLTIEPKRGDKLEASEKGIRP